MSKQKLSQSDELLARKHKFVRVTLAHHGISDAHTALVADLIHGLEDFEQPKSDLERRIDEVLDVASSSRSRRSNDTTNAK